MNLHSILEDFPYDEFKISEGDGGLKVVNPIDGKLFFPDKIIEYYHRLYADGIEHKSNFVRYAEEMDKAIESDDVDVKIEKAKDVSRWFAFVQMNAESYSIAAYLIHRVDLDRDDMISLYNAYAREDTSLVPEGLMDDFIKALHNVLYYFKFLIGVFTVLD